MNDESERTQDSTHDHLNVQSHKSHFLQIFYKSLEDLAYIQLACLFYVDNSIILTLLRASTIVNIIPQPSRHRLPLVLLVNAGCIFAHLFNDQPAPATNGARMLSGGLLVDFCGEYAYTSKLRLVVLDLVILSIMFMMLLVANEKTNSQVEADKPEEIVVDPRILEEGRQGEMEAAEPENENHALLSEETSLESLRMLEISIANGVRDIVADPVRSDTDPDPVTRNQETLRTLITAISARAIRR